MKAPSRTPTPLQRSVRGDILDGCEFCAYGKLEGDPNSWAGGRFLSASKHALAFWSIVPRRRSHVLVVPRRHYMMWSDVDDTDVMKDMWSTVGDVIRELGLSHYNVQQNSGPEAGQTVFHLHLHVMSNLTPQVNPPPRQPLGGSSR